MENVEWGEYQIGDLFEIHSSNRIFHANNVIIYPNRVENSYEYIVRATTNNGQRGYIKASESEVNDGNCLSFAQDTFKVFYHKNKFATGNKVKVLKPKFDFLTPINAKFIIATINHSIERLSWGTGSDVKMIKSIKFKLPVKNNKIRFEFMENLVNKLEEEKIKKLCIYLKQNGLDNFQLKNKEQQVLEDYDKLKWKKFNLKELFGESTRGKRLKSEDRIPGNLPFVTAGEEDEGVSDFIGNNVKIFSKNTTTIDMFGSAKYRNYEYGGDDHVAIVHTENLPMNVAIFVTSAIHKSSHNGQFNYGRNFYAKDADELNILLPIKDGKPDFNTMETIISAIQKLVIKDVGLYARDKYKEIYTYGKENKIDNVKDVDGHVKYENSNKLNMVAEEGKDYKLEGE